MYDLLKLVLILPKKRGLDGPLARHLDKVRCTQLLFPMPLRDSQNQQIPSH